MARYIALLRAINVGGHTVKMETLRQHFEALSLERVETFIASGNVIFDSKRRSVTALQADIEAQLHRSLGYTVATFIRTPAEIAAVAALEPFGERARGGMYVGFVAEPITHSARARIAGFRSDIDALHVHEREVYWRCEGGFSDSAFSNAVIERALGVPVTFRSVTTVAKLAAKYHTTSS